MHFIVLIMYVDLNITQDREEVEEEEEEEEEQGNSRAFLKNVTVDIYICRYYKANSFANEKIPSQKIYQSCVLTSQERLISHRLCD